MRKIISEKLSDSDNCSVKQSDICQNCQMTRVANTKNERITNAMDLFVIDTCPDTNLYQENSENEVQETPQQISSDTEDDEDYGGKTFSKLFFMEKS